MGIKLTEDGLRNPIGVFFKTHTADGKLRPSFGLHARSRCGVLGLEPASPIKMGFVDGKTFLMYGECDMCLAGERDSMFDMYSDAEEPEWEEDA